MGRNLGSLLDLEPAEDEPKNDATAEPKVEARPEPKAETKEEPKKESADSSEAKWSSLINAAAEETTTTEDKKTPLPDIFVATGTPAGAYLGKKAYEGFVLPSQVRNPILNLNATNKALEGLHATHSTSLSELEYAKKLYDYMHSEEYLNSMLPERSEEHTSELQSH